jgi:acyl-coenzyme A thioesterase PaaI-like protein
MGGRARCIRGRIMIAIQTAQDFLKDNFAQWILDMGIAVTEMSDDGATLEIPITPHIERVGGIVCGQALSSLADTAMVFACFSAMDGFKPVATTNL